MLPKKIQQHKMEICQNTINNHRIIQKAFYKLSLKQVIKSSCSSTSRTWKTASSFNSAFRKRAISFVSIMNKPKTGDAKRNPYHFSHLIKKSSTRIFPLLSILVIQVIHEIIHYLIISSRTT